MKTATARRRSIDDEDFYPSSDGKPMAETDVHVLLMAALLQMLRCHYRPRASRIYVAANIFLYYREGDPKKRTSPDIMVVKGVDGRKLRRSFFTWKEQAVPCCVIELTSRGTKNEDQREKKAIFRRLGVKEYFLFDPLHEYLPKPLIGYRLVDGRYQRLKPDADGGIVSEELGLRLVPDRARLHLFDVATGERLLTPDELHELLDQERARSAELTNESEQTKSKIAELTAEIERLRKRKNGPNGQS